MKLIGVYATHVSLAPQAFDLAAVILPKIRSLRWRVLMGNASQSWSLSLQFPCFYFGQNKALLPLERLKAAALPGGFAQLARKVCF
jgi:hypothetical protein